MIDNKSPITKRTIPLKSYDDLVTNDSNLKKQIEDKYLVKSSTNLSVDYSNYENFINFSSAESRLKNFKYKVKQIEEYTQESASFVGSTTTTEDTIFYDNKIIFSDLIIYSKTSGDIILPVEFS